MLKLKFYVCHIFIKYNAVALYSVKVPYILALGENPLKTLKLKKLGNTIITNID